MRLFKKNSVTFLPPASGRLMELSEVPDEDFAQKMLGDGYAVDPTNGAICAPLGVMIEVPTALVLTREFSQEVVFLSFGTNDLLQYTSASDRMNAQVASWYDPYQPAFLRLIHLAVQGANGMHVGMCGDLAGDERLLPFWSAIGIEEFGVPAAKLSRTKQILRRYPAKDQGEWIQSVLDSKTSQEVIARLHRD